jgi:hypothetical protein
MKKTLGGGIILMLALIIPTRAEEFGYPAGGEAWYFIKAGFANTTAVGKGLWTIKNVYIVEVPKAKVNPYYRPVQ